MLLLTLFLQKENLDLAFKTGECVGITATLVRWVTQYISGLRYFESCLKLKVSAVFLFLHAKCVAESGGHAESGWARLAEGSGLCGKRFPSL